MTRFTLLILASAAVIPVSGCASAGLPLYPTAENINARPFFVAGSGSFHKPDVFEVAAGGKPLTASPLVEVAEVTAPPATQGPIKLVPGPVTVEPLPPPAAVGNSVTAAPVAPAPAPIANDAPTASVPAPAAVPAVSPSPAPVAVGIAPTASVPAPAAAPVASPAPAPVAAGIAAAASGAAPIAPVAAPVAPVAPGPSLPASASSVEAAASNAPATGVAPAASPSIPPAAVAATATVGPAVVVPVDPPAPPPPPLPQWTMERGGTLVGTVTAWAQKAGWNPPMRVKADDWLIEVTPPPLTATFEEAVQFLADGFQRAVPRPRITLSPAARSILIESVN